MSKNYTNYSKPNKTFEKPVVEPMAKEVREEDDVTVENVAEAIEAVSKKMEIESTKGVVANCKKLNVRQNPFPTAPIVKVINEGTAVEIDDENSTINFYKVSGKGFDGYCMKKFIDITQ